MLYFLLFRTVDSLAPQPGYVVPGNDKLPLAMEDFRGEARDLDGYHWWASRSVLLSYTSVYADLAPPAQAYPPLECDILDTRLVPVFDLCLRELLARGGRAEDAGYRRTDDPAWQADWVYQLYDGAQAAGEYLLCWGKRVVCVRFGEAPTAAQIAAAADRLRA